ncbi:polysaccharide biosynthesis protein [Bilifractor sp. LCP21S3_A7]|uniref:polysaccharide biosynthesis protein n=1 Tax=Bilifractor sp. LCP21S3_A7 TaxID=3438738 RepID=UPI003F915714
MTSTGDKKEGSTNGSQLREDSRYKMRVKLIFAADIIATFIAYFFSLWLRFDFQFSKIPLNYLQHLLILFPIICATTLIVYRACHLYQSIWRYASISEAYHIIIAYLILAAALLVENLISWPAGVEIPRSVAVMGYIISLLFCVAIRFGYRMIRYVAAKRKNEKPDDRKKRVMIVGAGQSAKELINDFRLGGHSNYQICTIVDDNPTKLGRYLEGHCIEGNRYDIPELARKYGIDIIIVAIPSASNEDRISILNICQETGCKLQIVPGIYQIVNGDVQVSRLRDVQIEDLLGRDEVKINLTEIKKTIEGKVVMVTGGGGSIGSELCRQIASANPKQLIIFDIYENNAYAIQQELIRKYGDKLNLVTLIGSVRNTSRINSVLETYHPEMIYHAAAHKHVPLMENSPCEAIKNNVMGTYKLAKAAAEHGVKRFLLISTDKAVNPTSLMGATKRMCEMIIQMMDRKYPGTTFMAVRFGNVLGSNGSVIPLFKEQIAKGGPVTVTDKNIIRYFMTIPEAVSLVLEASIYAKGGEIFVLDMGKPVRIDDMARKLIRLSGFQPDVDIKIVYTGLRPGEKLYEELLMDEEGMKDTPNKLIHIGHPIEMDDELFLQQIHRLDQVSKQEVEPMEMKRVVSEVVTTYKPDLEHVDQSQGVIAS